MPPIRWCLTLLNNSNSLLKNHITDSFLCKHGFLLTLPFESSASYFAVVSVLCREDWREVDLEHESGHARKSPPSCTWCWDPGACPRDAWWRAWTWERCIAPSGSLCLLAGSDFETWNMKFFSINKDYYVVRNAGCAHSIYTLKLSLICFNQSINQSINQWINRVFLEGHICR